MPSELEELVEFLHHGNTQIRQVATENLVPFSKVQPAIFSADSFRPVKDLKVLVKDYSPIAKNALIILINISPDPEVLRNLAEDDAFLETLLLRLTSAQEPNGDEFSMLLANLAKSPAIERLTGLQRPPVPTLSPSRLAITQLLALYNAGPTGNYSKFATYDYLAYVFADLAKFPAFQTYLTTPPPKSALDPLTTFLPLTTHPSPVRRLGTATLLRNLALAHPDPMYLVQPANSILPPLLLPLCSSDQSGISEEEMESLPEDCQFLVPGEHKAETDVIILNLHLESLYLATARGGVPGRKVVHENGTYPVIRELHLRADDEGLRRACERLVDVLMVGEADEAEARQGGFDRRTHMEAQDRSAGGGVAGEREIGTHGSSSPAKTGGGFVQTVEDEDDDNEIVPIF